MTAINSPLGADTIALTGEKRGTRKEDILLFRKSRMSSLPISDPLVAFGVWQHLPIIAGGQYLAAAHAGDDRPQCRSFPTCRHA
jgi:hypothetical protein